jgi:hypothetical protein
MAGSRTFDEVRLDELRAMYEATRNPVIVWWAIDTCLNISHANVLPEWCLDVLADAARNIQRLSAGKDYRPAIAPPGSENLAPGDPVDKSAAGKIN